MPGQSTPLQAITTSALAFDGTGAQVDVTQVGTGNPALLTDVVNTFTVEAWVKPTLDHEWDTPQNSGTGGTGGQRYLMFPTVGAVWGDDHAGMGISVGKNGVSVYEHAGGYMPALLVWQGSITEWTHVAVVYQDGRPSLYINGEWKVDGEQSAKAYVHPSLNIGGGVYGHFAGQVDEVRIWREARQPAQLLAQCRQVLSTPAANLVACWHLDEGSGALTADAAAGSWVSTLTRGPVQLVANGPVGPAPPGPLPQWQVPSSAPLTPDPSAAGLTYSWSPAVGLDQTTGARVNASPTATTTYNVTATNSCGEQTTVPVTVTVSTPLCVAPVLRISPNATITAGQSTPLQVQPVTGALEFDGAGAQVSVTQAGKSNQAMLPDVANTFTVEAWVKPTATHEVDGQGNLGIGGTSGQRYLVYPFIGEAEGHAGMGISVGTNGVSVYEHAGGYMPALLVWEGSITNWTHVAVVYQDGRPSLYINGEWKADGEQSAKAYVHPSLNIGGSYYGYFAGQVDEVRIWREARQPAQLLAQHQQALPTPAANLVACWHLDEGSGTRTTEAVGGPWTSTLTRSQVSTNWTPTPAGPLPQWLAPSPAPLDPLTYSWSPTTGLDQTTAANVNARPATTTTYTVTATTTCGQQTTGQVTITVTVPANLPPNNPDANLSLNWTLERSFDGNGNVVAESKQFTDGLGRPTQAQARNSATQQVFASQTVYSSGGQPVLQTLAAPINNQSFNYQQGFITANSAEYGPAQFENLKPTDAPAPVDAATKGTLGYYFSALNEQEPLTPITSYPYSLVEPSEGPLGGTRRAAAPGDELRMGKGRESRSREFTLHKEFDDYLRLRPQFVPGSPLTTLEYQGTKSVSINADGRESIVVANKEGQALISCLSGAQYPALTVAGVISTEAQNRFENNAPSYQDIHIPAAGAQDVTLRMGYEYTAGGRVRIINLLTDDTVSYAITLARPGVDPEQHVTLEPGFYRLVSVTGGTQLFSYQAHYGNLSYTYYDEAGRAIATIAPNGLANSLAPAQPTFVTRNTYDTSSRLLATESDDEGRSEYVYAKDGRIRFSQSALQRSTGRFSYSNYDEVGRVVESGEYMPGDFTFENHLTATPVATSVLQTSLLEERMPANSLATANCSQRNQVWYDLPWDGTLTKPDGTVATDHQDSQLGGRIQEFVVGAVSKTHNDNVTTWYSYDELGRVTWVVQDIVGVGVKTLDYKYDFSGNVLEVAYQKGQADSFYHYYAYDAVQRLTTVSTSPDGIARTQQAEYTYYLHGPLKRVQVAGDLQGVDYTYTLQGALKSINHVEQTLEPGHDSPETNGVYKDLFALTLDYFSGDYRSRNLTTALPTAGGPSVPTRYDGTIQGATWRTAASPDLHHVAYSYDEKSQLQDAQHGQWQWQKSTKSYLLNAASTATMREGGISYDPNGNIQTLQRTGQSSALTDNFSYRYKANTNQLQAVHPAGAPSAPAILDYDYDELGQMTRQRDEQGQRYFTYNVTGKTTGVYLDAAHTQPVVTYAYDDRGFRVRQTVYPTTGEPIHITTYVRDMAGNLLALYEQETPTSVAQRSEVPLYGSGRLGTFMRLANGTTDYRYELTDHLGDARVVFHRPKTEVTVETMELRDVPATTTFQQANTYRVPVQGAPSGDYVARLTDSQPADKQLKRVLPVTKGDTITFSALAQWKQNAATGSAVTPYMLASAATGVNTFSQRGTDGYMGPPTTGPLAWLSQLAVGLGFTLSHNSAASSLGATSLEGWIKYRVLDTQGRPVLDAQGKPLVGVDYLLGTGGWEYLQTGVRIEQNGTIEVIAGTTGVGEAVYFDNLRVEQTGGLIVQEQHQYAFGAPLPGLSYSVGNRRYRYAYQGQYTEHDSLTGFESFELRLYNSRVGRWLSYDPKGQFDSPYVGMGNNPVSGIDPDGGWSPWGAAAGAVVGAGVGGAISSANGDSFWKGAAIGAGAGFLLGGLLGPDVSAKQARPHSLPEVRISFGINPPNRSILPSKLTVPRLQALPLSILMDNPLPGSVITSLFNVMRNIHGRMPHGGTDIDTGTGDPIYPAAPGRVERTWTDPSRKNVSYGYGVLINHGSAFDGSGTVYTMYGHASRVLVSQRGHPRVNSGTMIMRSGSTGRSTGSHLHYEVIKTTLNPNSSEFWSVPSGLLKPDGTPLMYPNMKIRYQPKDLRILLNGF